LEQAQRALDAGDILQAHPLFRQVTEQAPENPAGWLGMAATVRPYKDQQQYLQRALQLDPENDEARAQLADVESHLAAGEVLAPKRVRRIAATTQPDTPPADADLASSNGDSTVDVLYCYRHPDRETGLRCVKCERPICPSCTQRAAVGQLCPECARERRPRNYQVTVRDLSITAASTVVVAFLYTLAVELILGGFGFFAFFIAFIIAPPAAELLLRLLDRLTHAKRGKEMQLTAGMSYALGAALPILGPTAYGLLIGAGMGFLPLAGLLFTGIAIATLVTRLR
jgi:hypothetical protein